MSRRVFSSDAWAVGATYHGETLVNGPYVLHWTGRKWSTVSIPDIGVP
jgi:hypothetical protein